MPMVAPIPLLAPLYLESLPAPIHPNTPTLLMPADTPKPPLHPNELPMPPYAPIPFWPLST